MQELSDSRIYEFDEFRLNARSHRLYIRESGELVPLTPKAVELLIFLVRNKDRVLAKDELLDTVWNDSIVEESNLSQTIFILRKTLGENTKEPRFIRTVPNRGYQFIAGIREIGAIDPILEEEFLTDRVEKPAHKVAGTYLWLVLPLVLLAVLGVYWFYPAATPATVREIRSIAVLPFEDPDADQSQKYLGAGLADALANRFSVLKQITVRPSRTVSKYAESTDDASKIGRELQVDAILDGRIQRHGGRIRVSVQLIRTSDNATIWTENFDDEFTNFFAVQDSISRKVVQSLALQMNDREREKFGRRGTQNAEAYQDYLRGRYFWNKRTGDDLQKAIGHFEQAIQKDPEYALAYSGLADCYQLLAEYGAAAPHEAFPKAKAAVNKALEIDGGSAEAHTALGYMRTAYDWDWAGAEESFKRALEIDPDYATAHQWYAEYLVVMGRFDEAQAHFERAIQIEPVSPIILADLAALYDIQADRERELEQAKKVIEIDPNFAYGHFYMGMAFEGKGMYPEAVEGMARSMTLFGEPPEFAVEVKEAFTRGGIDGFWRKRLEQIETRAFLKNFQAYSKALVYIRLGDKERTMKALNEAFERRDRWVINAGFEPRLDPLRQDPRFQDLLRRLNLTRKPSDLL